MAVALPEEDGPAGTLVVPPHSAERLKIWMTNGYSGTVSRQDDLSLAGGTFKRVLSPSGWLNTEALYGQALVLTKQLQIDGIEDVFVMDPYAYDQMSYWPNRTAMSVGRRLASKKIDFRKASTVIFPAHVYGNHWTLFVWMKSVDGNVTTDFLDYYDSLGGDTRDEDVPCVERQACASTHHSPRVLRMHYLHCR